MEKENTMQGRIEEAPGTRQDAAPKGASIMGSMSEGKLLAKLAMPMIFSVLVSSLYNIIDSIFVGMFESAL